MFASSCKGVEGNAFTAAHFTPVGSPRVSHVVAACVVNITLLLLGGTSTRSTSQAGNAREVVLITTAADRAKAPFRHWKIQTFIAGLRHRGLTAAFVIDQP